MAQWDRFDICAAYQCLEVDYNQDGWLRERPSNQRRHESIGVQLSRMQYSSGMGGGGFDTLDENAQEIYMNRVLDWGLPIDSALASFMLDYFILEFLQTRRPDVFGDCVAVAHNVCRTCGQPAEWRWGECSDRACVSHAQRKPRPRYADDQQEAARLLVRQYPNHEVLGAVYEDSEALADAVARLIPDFQLADWARTTIGQIKAQFC